MKKTISMTMAVLLAAVLSVFSFGNAISAKAIYIQLTSFDDYPEGYTQFDDGGYFAPYGYTGDPQTSYVTEYRTYYKDNDLYEITHSTYNKIQIRVYPDMYETYAQIWEQYQDAIYYTDYNEEEAYSTVSDDWYIDVTIKDMGETVSPTYDAVMSFGEALRESGAVLRATYTETDNYSVQYPGTICSDAIYVDYDGDDMTTDSLLAIASDYLDDPTVEADVTVIGDGIIATKDKVQFVSPYVISSSPNIPTSLALVNAISDAYPEANARFLMGPVPEEENTSTVTDTIDLLAQSDENSVDIICGDVNFDGAVNLSDVVTLSKASSGVIDVTDNMIAAGDIDGDGEITEDDSLILLQFQMGLVRAIPLTAST